MVDVAQAFHEDGFAAQARRGMIGERQTWNRQHQQQ
jgi:hypothetical protein